MRCKVIGLLLLSSLLGEREAQAAPGDSLASGGGIEQCAFLDIAPGAQWQADAKTIAAVLWAQGYISGINHANLYRHARTVDLTGGQAEQIWAAIVEGCSRNEGATVQDIVTEYFSQHMH